MTNGSGTVIDGNITNVAVDCVTPAGNGALDAGFGSGGKVTKNFAGGATAIALQNDGKTVLLGNRLLARHNTDGSPDTSFGAGGQVSIVFNGGVLDAAQALAIQADGKIVVVGFTRVGTSDDFAVARHDANGTLDASFGAGGKASVDFSGSVDKAWAVLIQTDGSIVVAGHANNNSPGETTTSLRCASPPAECWT